MSNYKIIEMEGMDGVIRKHVIINNENGSVTSFPASEDNPEYQQWLAQGNKLPKGAK